MELNDKVTQLEDEIKILKNEVQAVLLDLRESFLNNTNPFNPNCIVNQSSATVPAPEPPLMGTITEPPAVTETESAKSEPAPEKSGAGKSQETADARPDDDEVQEIMNELPGIADLFGDDAPAFMPGLINTGVMAAKEKNKMYNPASQAMPDFRPNNSVAVADRKLDLETIEKFSAWVDTSVQRLGHERTRTILDITETMGYIEADLKKILVRFIHPDPSNEDKKVTTRDYLTSLVEFNRLLQADNRMEIALLFILITFQEYDNR